MDKQVICACFAIMRYMRMIHSCHSTRMRSCYIRAYNYVMRLHHGYYAIIQRAQILVIRTHANTARIQTIRSYKYTHTLCCVHSAHDMCVRMIRTCMFVLTRWYLGQRGGKTQQDRYVKDKVDTRDVMCTHTSVIRARSQQYALTKHTRTQYYYATYTRDTKVDTRDVFISIQS